MAGEHVFEMAPQGWESTTLGEVVRRGAGHIQTGPFGSQLHAADYVPIGIPTIMPVNIGDNQIIELGIARIKEEDAKRLSKHRVETGDIVYSRRGDVERRALIRKEQKGWLCGTGCLKVRVGKGVVDPSFTSYFLGHPKIRAWIVQHAVGATMPNLNTSIMEAVPFLLPPLHEQQAIACILGALDDKIELNRRRNRTLEAMARALFQSWFVDFDPVKAKSEGRKPPGLSDEIAALFPDRFADSPLGEIPKGWLVRPLPVVCEVNPTRSLSKGNVAPYLDMANMPTQGPSPEAWVMREMGSGMKFINGDTLVARITPCLENGKTAFVDFLDDRQVGWGSTEYIVLRPKGSIPPVFAYLLARTENFRSFAIQQMTGSSGRQRVPADSLGKYLVGLPDSEDKLFEKFGNIVTSLFECITANKNQSRTLAALRDTLLPKLISGELRVPDAERIIGRVL